MNFVKVTAPFGIDDIKKYFDDKENTFFLVDYDNSELKGNKLLVYLSNIGIGCDLFNIPQEEVPDLLREYLTTDMLVDIPSLVNTGIVCLLYKTKGEDVYGESLMDKNLVYKFIEYNQDILEKLEVIFTSMSLYNLYTIEDDSFKEYATSFEHIDDDKYVGINFANFFLYEAFFQFYGGTDKSKMRFFDKQFKEYMFKGKSLFDYWHNDYNILSLMTMSISYGQFDQEKFEQLFKDNAATEQPG